MCVNPFGTRADGTTVRLPSSFHLADLETTVALLRLPSHRIFKSFEPKSEAFRLATEQDGERPTI
jgi:hypothetical protein